MTWELAQEERDFRSNSHSTPQFRIICLFSRSESKQSEFKTPILDSQRKTHLQCNGCWAFLVHLRVVLKKLCFIRLLFEFD